jgi:DNA-binding LytR/AlgR family response regulator
MIRYIIIDDEPIAHKIIASFGENIPHLELQANCYNAMEAMEYLRTHPVDLIFLDINMPKLKGLDFLKLLDNPPTTIITTAYEEFALEGYELNVADYLLKPFSFERFAKAVYKVVKQEPIPENTPNSESKENESIFLKGDKKHIHIKLRDILHIESLGSYCKVITPNETVVTHQKISSFEDLLDANLFIRVHKSFIVAKEHIKQIEGNRILVAETQIPIGRTFKDRVLRLYNN